MMVTDSDLLVKHAPVEEVISIRHRVMYPDMERDAVRLDDDADGIHLGLYQQDELLSVVSLFDRGTSIQFRKFATETEKQGKGYGSRLLAYVMDYAAAGAWQSIWCNARSSAAGFYEAFGMSVTGEPWMQYGIEFIRMEKKLK